MKFEQEIIRDYSEVLIRAKWLIKKLGNSRFTADAEDLVSEAMVLLQSEEEYHINTWKFLLNKPLNYEKKASVIASINTDIDYENLTFKFPNNVEERQCKVCMKIMPVFKFNTNCKTCKYCYYHTNEKYRSYCIELGKRANELAKDSVMANVLRRRFRSKGIEREPTQQEIEDYRIKFLAKREFNKKFKHLPLRERRNLQNKKYRASLKSPKLP